MPMAAAKKAAKLPNWVDIFEYAKTILPSMVDEISYHKRLNNTPSVLEVRHAIEFSGFIDKVKNLDDSSVFKKTIMPLIEGKEKSRDNVMTYAINIEYLHHVIFPEVEIVNTKFYNPDAFNAYPMLSLVDTVSNSSNWSTLFEYIQMIDRSKK